MKKVFSLLLTLVLLAGMMGVTGVAALAAEEETAPAGLTIVFTGGTAAAAEDGLGFDSAAALKATYKSDAVLLVDAGGFADGAAPVMSTAGYDLAVPGAEIAGWNVKAISMGIEGLSDGAMFEKNGVKAAFVGVVPGNDGDADAHFAKVAEAVAAARSAGADYVIALGRVDSAAALAEAVPGIDAILTYGGSAAVTAVKEKADEALPEAEETEEAEEEPATDGEAEEAPETVIASVGQGFAAIGVVTLDDKGVSAKTVDAAGYAELALTENEELQAMDAALKLDQAAEEEAPAEEETPAEEIPAEDAAPAEGEETAAEGEDAAPAEGEDTAAAGEEADPAKDDAAAPAEGEETAKEEESAPAEGEETAKEEETAPAEGEDAAKEEETTPAQGEDTAKEEETKEEEIKEEDKPVEPTPVVESASPKDANETAAPVETVPVETASPKDAAGSVKKWTKGDQDMVFVLENPIASLTVNGMLQDAKYYKLSSQDKTLSFQASVLNDWGNGNYNFVFSFTDGTPDKTVTVNISGEKPAAAPANTADNSGTATDGKDKESDAAATSNPEKTAATATPTPTASPKKNNSPATGDNSPIMTYVIVLAVMAVALIVVVVLLARKKKH